MHPLLTLLATRPDLLADHAQAYAALAAQEFGMARASWRTQTVVQTVGLFSLSAAVMLAGVALMLWATTAPQQIRVVWLLWLTPLLPLACGLACLGWAHQHADATPFAELRKQFSADMTTLRAASTP